MTRTTSDRASPRDDASRATWWAVPVAGGVLVALSWIALVLAPEPNVDAGPVLPTADNGSRVPVTSTLAGFHSGFSYLPDDAMLGFVEIPGGAFVMGSDPGRDSLSFKRGVVGQRPCSRPARRTHLLSFEV